MTDKKTKSSWRGTWDRPMKIDEDSLDPLTVARMTDHNVRGGAELHHEHEKEESQTTSNRSTDPRKPLKNPLKGPTRSAA